MGKKKWTRPRSGPGASLKRGALRLKATKTEARSGKKHADYVPKSQLGEPEARRGREKLVVAGSALKQMTNRQLKQHLEKLGHVPQLKAGSACLFCGHKSLSVHGCPPLPAVLKGWSARYFRCTRKCCHKQQHFLSNSPVFYVGRGTDVPPLRQQVTVLWHLAWRTPGRLLRAEVGCNEKRIENMRHRWQGVLSKFVEETQSRSQGGDFQQVEVDETVVRKQKVGDTVAWQTFVGSKVRGQRKSLVLQKRGFANSLSKVRPSGLSAPPPLTTAEWQSFASEHLQSNTVVHTDGAQAYCAPVPNLHLRHDSVSHSTKKGGPYFTKNCTHKGVKKVDKRKSNLKTVAGTQCIDGTWTSLKRSCLGVNAKYPHKIEDHVREAQFHSWQGSADPWHAMGSVLRWHRAALGALIAKKHNAQATGQLNIFLNP
ncbi:unnamed protein product [Symbiodinium necroappetens]|uniref:ISXO2-like transposase domain-containing protein n=1 Tax=Symbiodinium necroappetens TaxID=1628268 RepID=A0A813A4H6_9DINO|nr:unnamed protein product [Symbiodinium necroappetens]